MFHSFSNAAEKKVKIKIKNGKLFYQLRLQRNFQWEMKLRMGKANRARQRDRGGDEGGEKRR